MEDENIFAMNEARKIAINKQRKAKISNIVKVDPTFKTLRNRETLGIDRLRALQVEKTPVSEPLAKIQASRTKRLKRRRGGGLGKGRRGESTVVRAGYKKTEE